MRDHRRDQKWNDKQYKKSHLGTRWKSNPFSGAGLNMNMNMSPFSFQQFGNNSFNQPKMQFPQGMPSFNPYSNLQGYRR